MSETTPTPEIKIVIVAGQEFSVLRDTPEETIRQSLLSQGFADVGAATIQRGMRDGVPTIEFVKKVGTKGTGAITPAALAAALQSVPPAPLTGPRAGPLLKRLLAGGLTCAEALDLPVNLALQALNDRSRTYAAVTEGEALCDRIDRLPACADTDPCVW